MSNSEIAKVRWRGVHLWTNRILLCIFLVGLTTMITAILSGIVLELWSLIIIVPFYIYFWCFFLHYFRYVFLVKPLAIIESDCVEVSWPRKGMIKFSDVIKIEKQKIGQMMIILSDGETSVRIPTYGSNYKQEELYDIIKKRCSELK